MCVQSCKNNEWIVRQVVLKLVCHSFIPSHQCFVAPVLVRVPSFHYLPQVNVHTLGLLLLFVTTKRAQVQSFVASVDNLLLLSLVVMFLSCNQDWLAGLDCRPFLLCKLNYSSSSTRFLFVWSFWNRSCETRSPIAWS